MDLSSISRAMTAALIAFFVICAAVAQAQDAKTLLKAGDQFYQKRDADLSAIQIAIRHWENAAATNPGSAEAQCRISKAYHYLSRFSPDGDLNPSYRESAVKYAQKAVDADEKDACGHYWLAKTMFELNKSKPVTQFFRALADINNHANKAKSLDPKIDEGGPDRLLAHIAYNSQIVKVEPAAEHIEAALAVSPNYHENLLENAQVLLKRKRYREARKVLDKLFSLKARPGETGEMNFSKRQAKALLESLPKEPWKFDRTN